MRNPVTRSLWTLMLLTALQPGCGGNPEPDERLVEFSRESLDRQAEQNRQVAAQSQQIAEAARQLVAADAESRREFLELEGRLQEAVQQERRTLDLQRDDLERERQDLAAARQREPVIANALLTVSVLLVAALPLLICVYVLRAMRDEPTEAAVSELLIHELASNEPRLLGFHEDPQSCLNGPAPRPDQSPSDPST